MRKSMRRFILVLSTVYMYSSLISCNSRNNEEEDLNDIKIGISVYEQDDIFISSIISNIENITKEKRSEGSYSITLNVEDAKSNQYNQNEQVDMFIDQGYDVMCINLVDRRSAATIINKAKNANIPVIFFNREPVEEDMNMWNKVYYVGAQAEQSGMMQGDIVIEKYKNNPSDVDKNGDGKIQYVMLEGEQGHQDASIRTEYSIKRLVDNGIKVEKLGSEVANWSRTEASEKVARWIEKYNDKVELIISNNDDMALGAIDVLNKSKIKNNMPLIVGVDGIKDAFKAIDNGEMTGTVISDAYKQGKAIFDTALRVSSESILDKDNGIDTRYIRIPHVIVTKENVGEYIR
ncbi:galactose ABC transporter substrate-binding protein [Clostridium sp.]|uniref:galactose ABC transporter substrate-binding protein n=1 Tax=Clostridium sp. TaxID=1506 RepID=UPI0029037471|nr:galactose ABC transporter substrate-binding protein [Clostridium sp.]MDU1077322.1 galactose ABC transporter substrate-binding protein [Clostridium sp.]